MENGGQRRGQLTNRIEICSEKLLGYKINKTELRLMPYIIDVMMNKQRLDSNKVNAEERYLAEMERFRIY